MRGAAHQAQAIPAAAAAELPVAMPAADLPAPEAARAWAVREAAAVPGDLALVAATNKK